MPQLLPNEKLYSAASEEDEMNESTNCVGLNEGRRQVTCQVFPAPIGKLLGLTLAAEDCGRATVKFIADARYFNPMGTLHGGVLCDIADAAMGATYRGTLALDESFTALELKINFLRPVWQSKLRAQAKIARAGRFVGLVECDVLDDQDRLVARAYSTYMTLRGQLAERRKPPAPST